MKINWICKQLNWAFGNLCSHLIKKMPKYKHVIDDKDGDINYICSPHFINIGDCNNRTILHIDSNRWYEHLISNEVE